MQERVYILGFSAFPGIGTRRFEQLINEFGSPQAAWEAQRTDLERVLGQAWGSKFDEFRVGFDVRKYAEEVRKKNIVWLTPQDKEYPVLLKNLNNVIPATPVIPAQAGIQEEILHSVQNDKETGSRVKSGMTKNVPGMTRAPFILFAKGNVDLLSSDKTIGIVGTRMVTNYGQQVTEMLTRELVGSGFTIISGMALGVDGIAHREALKNRGATIAVLGSGVDIPTPGEHSGLYKEILDGGGLIVSTFSPGEDAHKGSFPARNAIVAGLSLGIVVTEGAEKSGALITANYAKKFGRPVFSVPGQITSQLSKGTNNLIKSGAIPIESAYDIMQHIGYSPSPQPSPKRAREIKVQLSAEEQKIVSLLENGPLHFDEIARTIGKDSRAMGSVLSMMELKGMIRSNSEGKYLL